METQGDPENSEATVIFKITTGHPSVRSGSTAGLLSRSGAVYLTIRDMRRVQVAISDVRAPNPEFLHVASFCNFAGESGYSYRESDFTAKPIRRQPRGTTVAAIANPVIVAARYATQKS